MGWPELDGASLRDTIDTEHRWLQLVGKVRLALAPHLNHYWEATLYVTPRGLGTSAIPHDGGSFAIDLDFIDHRLNLTTSEGGSHSFPLRGQPIRDFHHQTMAALHELGIDVRIWPVPVEVDDRTPLDTDDRPRRYDRDQATAFWSALVAMEPVFERFRAGFIGKASPVHVFWGGYDLAASRFSGRRAPEHPGGYGLPLRVARDAYSHEVASAGFWSGAPFLDQPAFYAYVYPEPPGYSVYPVEPEGAYYHPDLREFILPYEIVCASADPDAALDRFLHSTYDAAADLGRWDRRALER